MATRSVTISDLTGQVIQDDDSTVTIVVADHPLIEEPVRLDASKDEVKSITGGNKDYAVLELISDGGDTSERVVMEIADFDKLFKDQDVDDVLSNAEKFRYGRPSAPEPAQPRRGRPPGSGSKPAAEKINYKELPNAGMPHRGRTTPEEAETVRNNLDAVNKNRVAGGHPPIDPKNEKDAARYGFDQMPEKDRPELSPEFKS